jgi:hypothetical protein
LYRGDDLTQKGKLIDYFGLIVSGTANVMLDHLAVKTLSVGDCIGQCYMAGFSETADTHRYTIRAASSGMIGILAKGDIDVETQKHPDGVSTFFITNFE